MKKSLLISCFTLFTMGLFAQTSNNPWQISLGLTNSSILSEITTLMEQ